MDWPGMFNNLGLQDITQMLASVISWNILYYLLQSLGFSP